MATAEAPEVVGHGRDGFPWLEPEARTLELAGDPALRGRLGEAARVASRRFSGERFAEAIAGVLRETLTGLPGCATV